MRSPQIRVRARTLAWIALLLLGALLVFVFWPRERVTPQNFSKIHIGMSQAELRHLLGYPHFQVVELGFVDGPETYTVNQYCPAKKPLFFRRFSQ